MEKESVSQNGAFLSDSDYIEEYFKICQLYQNKRILIREPMDPKEGEKEKKTNLSQGEKLALDRKCASLDKVINKKEEAFWQKVAASCDKKFVMEEISSELDLDIFEKRVYLFFLYLESVHISGNLCPGDELLRMFDTRNSTYSRLCNIHYLAKDGKLRKNGLLFSEDRRDYLPYEHSARMEYGITTKALNIVSQMLNGKKVELREGEKKEQSICDEVGFIKVPEFTLDDVMLKDEVAERILFFLQTYGDKRLERLGTFKKIKKSRGLNFLFYGPPGTGKSILAEAIAAYLNKKVLIVEFAKIISRWQGDTDKSITKIFKAARDNDMVLCIDEADSLFYSRAYAEKDHEIRFVNDMLQELERFEGVCVLTSNMEVLLDEAVERRISLKAKIDLPDAKVRLEIWKTHIPINLKVASDVDFAVLAKRYDFAGGYIKNAVLNAIRKVALKNQDTIHMDDLVFGAKMEIEGSLSLKNRPKVLKGFVSCHG